MSHLHFHYFREIPGYKELIFDGSVSLESRTDCPACGSVLDAVIVLRGTADIQDVRVGFCKSCGYVGYMDRPTKTWMDNFYTHVWDDASMKVLDQQEMTPKLSVLQRHLIAQVEKVSKRDDLVCDIGCGKGAVLKDLSARGYTNVIGVENSRYRSQVIRNNSGYRVVDGAFGSDAVYGALKSLGRVQVFFTSHVFEHIHDLERAFNDMALLQRSGDHVVFAVPQGTLESPANVLFWLPHLHSFTQTSLEYLFARYGYEVVETGADFEDSLVVVARKVDMAFPRIERGAAHSYLLALKRFQDYFLLEGVLPRKRYCLSWKKDLLLRKGLISTRHRIYLPKYLDLISARAESLYKRIAGRYVRRYAKERSFVFSVDGVIESSASVEETPLVIEYDGPVRLLVK